MTTTASGTARTGRPRGRRAAAKVPCDDCIARASGKKEEGAAIELCDKCTAALRQPRQKQQNSPSVKRIRRQSKAIIDTALGISTDPIDMPWSDDHQEQRSLQFFVNHSSPHLAGYFDSPFWQRTVLQAGQHEPAVRHAIAAIGALHEKLLTGVVSPDQTDDRRTRFALEQCNKSIRHLVTSQNSNETPDLQLMLTASVLYTCFEALQGHCEQAMIHATQGYNLLQQYAMHPENRRWDVGAFAVELDQLCLLMRRLQTQPQVLMDKDINMLPEAKSISKNRPAVFSSLQEARSGLAAILNQLTVFFLDLELDDYLYELAVSNSERHTVFGAWLADWEKAFSAFLSENRSKLGEEGREAAMVLKAHHLVAEVLSDVDLSLGELGWDAFHNKFAAIVDLAAAILKSNKQMDTSVIEARWKTNDAFISGPTATLSFSLGIVDPLYEVCSRCRDSKLRRRALDLLARHPRQECVWSSWSAWKVGKFLMRLEEDATVTQMARPSDGPAGQIISESLRNIPDHSTQQTRTNNAELRKALPRATARYSLNPGLFEDWSTTPTGFETDFDTGPVYSASDAFMTLSAIAEENSAAFTAAMPNEFTASAWIDFESLQHITDLPIIRETPPAD